MNEQDTSQHGKSETNRKMSYTIVSNIWIRRSEFYLYVTCDHLVKTFAV